MISDRFISISALVVAIFSAIISAATMVYSNKNSNDQMSTTETYNKLSVLPKLSSTAVFNSEKDFSGIGVENKGLGPAIIKNVQYSIDGGVVSGDEYKSMLLIISELKMDVKNLAIAPVNIGQIIKPDQETWILASKKNSKDMSRAMLDVYKRMNISVCYCSLYNECQVKSIGRPMKYDFQCE